ncbi:hypothetical protein Ancab_023136 [Ancistrocladus abbreviatus]
MSVMPQMLFIALTMFHLVMTGAGCQLCGLWVSGVAIVISKAANERPTKTLLVINFNSIRTRVPDLERHFEPYGKVLGIRIQRNFAFVQFGKQEDSTKALECTHMSKLLHRVISVEYALQDGDERDDRLDSHGRGYSRCRGSPYRHSPSPACCRSRPSHEYGRPCSLVYDRYNGPSYHRQGVLSTVIDMAASPQFGGQEFENCFR